VFCRYQMLAKIEKIVDSSVRVQKSLCLMRRLESPHTSLPNPGWVMGTLGSIIGVLGGVMGRIRDEFSVSDTVTPQLVGDDSSGLTDTRS
jgi:hypothetical protein